MKKIFSFMIIKLITSSIPRPLNMSIALSFLLSLTFCQGIFTLSAQVWTQVGNDIDGEAADDWSGNSVSISADGKSLAIGASHNDGGNYGRGHVRVYSESGGVWTQLGSDINGEAAGDLSGSSVAISGDGQRVVIGANWNDGNGTNAGHVRVYKLSGGAWVKQGSDIDGEAVDDWSGFSVSTSFDGKIVAIGAFNNDGNGTSSGHVRVYKQTGSNWTKLGSDIDGEAADDWFGRSVSLSSNGKRLAVAAPGNDGNGMGAGHVRVYSESGGTWTQLGSDIDGEAAGDASGLSVSLSPDGKRVAIGAIYNDGSGTDAGHVRVYEENGGTWMQLGSDIDGEAPGDRSGWYVSMSTNGQRVAIGSYENDGNGTSSGHVRVFSESSGVWTQVATDIDGEAAWDESGNSVSISGSGERVAIGAIRNDGSGINAGHVRVYEEVSCDADGDGYDNVACGGSDCDDDNLAVNPGATEVCNGEDDDCDGLIDDGTNDTDGDGICDSMDNCPTLANSNQADTDGDGTGDACDACPNDPDNDTDGDGICGDVDNCPSNSNTGQEDSDCDTVGDVCDVCPGGDDSVDNNNDGIPDCSQLLNYTAYSAVWKCGTNKIYVCHSDVTTCISKNQLSTHYSHGDDIGPCVSCGGQNLNMPGSTPTMMDADIFGLAIFPNPAFNEVTFHLSHFDDEATELTLFDYSGKTIWQTTIEEGQRELRLDLSGSEFINGVYIVKANYDGHVLTGRLVIFR